MSEVRYLVGDVFERMAELPDASVDLIVTSPPFLALRSYLPAGHRDKSKEIGSEPTPAAFLSTLLRLTQEWRRLLTPFGSIAVELGDTYSGAGGYGDPDSPNPAYGAPRFEERWTGRTAKRFKRKDDGWPEAKSLCGIPDAYTLSLEYGWNMLNPTEKCDRWRVRNKIVWHRPNPPVGALGDKVRPSTSYITIACVSKYRWFDLDAERTPAIDTNPRTTNGTKVTPDWHDDRPGRYDERIGSNPAGAPPLDCWTIPTAPYSGSHYATFPPALPRRLINLMCPRTVCLTCGEPRRRIVSDRAAFDVQPLLAAHIRERREFLGITPQEINERLGYKEIAKNWERTDKHGAAIPNAKDWAILKPWLGLSDEYDAAVLGERRWTESAIDYIADGRRLGTEEKRNTYDRGGNGYINGNRTKADRHAPDDWSDCGHDNYRRGRVLDPFGGSGTTGQAAAELGRNAILIDLDERNLELARQRCGLFLTEEIDA